MIFIKLTPQLSFMIFIDVYLFQTTDFFLCPLIISDNNRFSVVHRGYREKTSSMKWIKKHSNSHNNEASQKIFHFRSFEKITIERMSKLIVRIAGIVLFTIFSP